MNDLEHFILLSNKCYEVQNKTFLSEIYCIVLCTVWHLSRFKSSYFPLLTKKLQN